MACTLKRRQSDGVFVGTAGRKARVDVQSEQPATLVQLIYAGELDGTPPFEFTIQKGRQKLLIVAAGVVGDQRMKIVELRGRGLPSAQLLLVDHALPYHARHRGK